MTLATTLSIYIARVFTLSVLAMLASLSGLVSLFDFIELLRRSATRPDATFSLVAQIAALRLPFIMMQILPFAVLLGGIVAFWRLTRSSELVVARAAGVSAWQFLSAPMLSAVLLGMLATGAISPLSSVMLGRAEVLDNAYLRSSGGPLALTGGQLWLRQSDRELTPQGVAILHARAVSLRGETLQGSDVSVFQLDDSDRFLQRIEAVRATLAPGFWWLDGARIIKPDHLPEPVGMLRLPTDLTVGRVQESFASPDTFSVWALPNFIDLLERSGFSAIRHRLHFQALLALPLLAGVMCLVSAGFSMRPARRGGVARMIASGVAAGFALFVISKVAEEFGQSGALPPALAAWAPAGAGLMLAHILAAPSGRRLMRRFLLFSSALVACVIAVGASVVMSADPARAQFSAIRGRAGAAPVQPLSRDEPVTFTADQVQYDRDNATVTASGNVEAWQNDNVVRADRSPSTETPTWPPPSATS